MFMGYSAIQEIYKYGPVCMRYMDQVKFGICMDTTDTNVYIYLWLLVECKYVFSIKNKYYYYYDWCNLLTHVVSMIIVRSV